LARAVDGIEDRDHRLAEIETSRPGRRTDGKNTMAPARSPGLRGRELSTKVKYVNYTMAPIQVGRHQHRICSQAVQHGRPRAHPRVLPKRIFRRRDRFPSG